MPRLHVLAVVLSGCVSTASTPDTNTDLVSAEGVDYVVIEGDIIVGIAGYRSAPNGVSTERWPSGLVPYSISGAVSDPDRVHSAIAHIEANSAVRFVERTTEADYVHVQNGSGCSSWVGKQGGRQTLTLSDTCSAGTTIHEFGHALGLWHEQGRPDRGDYVEVINSCIEWGEADNFDIKSDAVAHGPYDYLSIMHYGADYFLDESNTHQGAPCRATLLRTDGTWIRRQREALSVGDIDALDDIYGASDTPLQLQLMAELVAGQVTSARVWGLTPTTGQVGVGISVDGLGSGPCIRGFCSSLSTPMLAGLGLANSHGIADVQFTVPPGVDVSQLGLQAFSSSSGDFIASNPTTWAQDAPTCNPYPEWAIEIPAGDSPRAVHLADVNGDGALDVLLTNEQESALWIFEGLVGGGLSDSASQIALPNLAYRVGSGDFNADTHLDLVVSSHDGSNLMVVLADGFGGWQTPVSYPAGLDQSDVEVGDLNGDGVVDLVSVARVDGLIVVHHGVGDGSFVGGEFLIVGGDPYQLELADLDQDGDLDLVVGRAQGDTVDTHLNVGGVLQAASHTVPAPSPYGLAIADLDQDGLLDVAIRGEDELIVAVGAGDGSFTELGVYSTTEYGEVVAADFDNDGALDLAVSARVDAAVRLFYGAGDGTFAAPTTHGAAGGTWGLAAADYDMDGHLDLVVAGHSSHTLGVLLSTCP